MNAENTQVEGKGCHRRGEEEEVRTRKKGPTFPFQIEWKGVHTALEPIG